MDDRLSRFKLIALALLAAATVPSKDAAGQVRSNVATVTLVATAPAGASFRPALEGEPTVFRGTAGRPGFSLVVNAPYRLRVRTEASPASAVTLSSDGRPGPVRLDGVRQTLEAAGIGAPALPVTVELVIAPAL